MTKKIEYKIKNVIIIFVIFIAIFVTAELLGYGAMSSFGKIEVSNVNIENYNGLNVRGKLYRPKNASVENKAPGVVYLHGYQNNRETSDPYAIELSRRGFVVINIDTLGRGNSDNQRSENVPGFDKTYGGNAAFEYLRNLPFVDSERCGLGGHSLGGEMSYAAAMDNHNVKAIVFSGFAWDTNATFNKPANMLMIFGKYDEYRKRMTGVSDFVKDWMKTPQVADAIKDSNPVFDKTYGDFSNGTARRVHLTDTTHVGECFDNGALAEAIKWFSASFGVESTIPPESQIWRIKEICSLVAMIAAIASIIPLIMLLLKTKLFSKISGKPGSDYVCDKKDLKKGI
ncbi:MAG: alpha/beta hydrolase, partial [Spirochaetales bacterium]|nr:alpha/beta hydrolase [Spirochaetales bacterium]